MSKVNWGAKTDYEYVSNYKILQGAFQSLNVDKHVDVDKLTRAKYQDNLEFMQWLRKFYEDNCSSDSADYDAVGRRNKGKNVRQFPPAQGGPPAPSKPARRTPPVSAPARTKLKENDPKVASGASHAENVFSPVSSSATKGVSSAEINALKESLAESTAEAKVLKTGNADLKIQVDGLERERDFYFGKLREVEVLLQQSPGEDKDLTRNILKILYATEDDTDGEQALAAAEQAMAAVQESPAREGKVTEPYAEEY